MASPDQRSERPLNSTAASLLGFLHEGSATGWDLLATSRERIGDFWTLTQSQVYRELASMASAGLIEAGATGPRDRRPYTLTTAGRRAFERWAEQPPGPDHLRIPLLLALTLAEHLPAERLQTSLSEQREQHRQQLAGYRAQLDELLGERRSGNEDRIGPGRPGRLALAPLRYGIAHEEAVLAWFEELLSPEPTSERQTVTSRTAEN